MWAIRNCYKFIWIVQFVRQFGAGNFELLLFINTYYVFVFGLFFTFRVKRTRYEIELLVFD